MALVMALALAGVIPAGAQSTATVRVSNLEAAESNPVQISLRQQYAQSFCTGPYAVTLDKVRLATRTQSPDPAPSVTIHSDRSGAPGQTVATLSNPETFDNSMSTHEDFTSSGIELDTNARYWVVVSAQQTLVVGVTESTQETAEAGWAISDRLYGNFGGWRPAFGSDRLRMRMAIYASGATPSITQPVFPCSGSTAALTMEVNENAAAGAVVGQVTAEDADNDAVTHSVSGADAAGFNEVFSINTGTGEITVKTGASPNYEEKRSYSITVDATDGEDASGNAQSPATTDASVSVTIRVNNVDEAGTITMTPATPAVGGEFQASLTDPDDRLLIVSMEWYRSDTAAGPFTSIGDNNRDCLSPSRSCIVPAAEDQGKFLKVVITYYDGASGPRNSRGNLIISSADPTRDRRTIEAVSSNAVVMGGL